MSTGTTASSLGQPVGDGLTWVNFFNGRLLTGDDLSGEQDSGGAARQQLGVASGAGVASGLMVAAGPSSSLAQPTVQVTAGLAVNGLGKALSLDATIELSLLAPASSAAAQPATAANMSTDGAFGACGGGPPPPTAYLSGSGVYVLVIGPAERGQGSATVNGGLTADPARTVGYTIDTVEFRLAAAPIASTDAVLTSSQARNLIAYGFLGTADPRRNAAESDPLAGAPSAYSMVDDMVAGGAIAASEVPLAVIYWTATQGFQFIDLWAVRRRVARPNSEAAWAPFVEDRSLVEGEAMFLQFQAQVADPAFASIATATGAFAYLPPAGFVPLVATPSPVTSPPESPPTSSPPVDAGFFAGLTTRGPFFINAARVDDLIRESFAYPPIDVQSHEVIWLYEVRENQPVAGGTTTPVLLFSSGHLAYRATARFDIAYYDRANYALRSEWRVRSPG